MGRWTWLDRKTPTVAEAELSPPLKDPAVAIIDEALLAFVGRSLVSGDEVVDRLLDLRGALVAATSLRELDELCSTPWHHSGSVTV
jgi:hypothetical protein